MAFELRDYQLRLVDEGIAAMEAGNRPALFAPTGAGKSVVLGEIANRLINDDKPVIVSCHRREIAKHLEASLEKHLGIKPGLVTADSKTDMEDIKSPVILAMMPTISRRLKKLPSDWVGKYVLLTDECHHATSTSWLNTIEALQPRSLLGCSATLVSCNTAPLSRVFGQIIYGPSLEELVDQGHLARPILYGVDPSQAIDVSGWKSRGGDYLMDDNAAAAAIKLAGSSVEVWKKLNSDRLLTLAACVNVVHAQELAEAFNDADIPAAAVHGSMPDAERDKIIADFTAGRIRVMAFCQLIDEGFDVPEASCILWCRPTRSIRVHRQINGRGSRVFPGKSTYMIIDQVGNHSRLPMPLEHIEWDLNLAKEDGARRRGFNPDKQEIVEDKESGVIELRDITPERFIEIQTAARRPPCDQTLEYAALHGGVTAVREFLRDRHLEDRYDQLSRFARAALLRTLRASETADMSLFQAVGEGFGFSPMWGAETFEQSLRDEANRFANRRRFDRARRVVTSALEDAVAAGELGERVLERGRVEVLGERVGILVISVHSGGIQAQRELETRDRVWAALEERVRPYTIGAVVLSRHASMPAVYDARIGLAAPSLGSVVTQLYRISEAELAGRAVDVFSEEEEATAAA